MKPVVRALLCAVIIAAACAPSALAATVTVQTVDPFGNSISSPVTMPAATVPTKDGNPSHTCLGTSAAAALQSATGGDWTGDWFGSSYFVSTLRGVNLSYARNQMYWSFYVSGVYSATEGLCEHTSANGEVVQLYPECGDTAFCLFMDAPGGRVAPGSTFTVRVGRSDPAPLDASFNPTGPPTVTPENGATVSGGGQTTTTGSDGRATLAITQRGSVTIAASRAGGQGDTRTICVSDGADGYCGTAAPAGPAPATTTTEATPPPAPAAAADPAPSAPAPAPVAVADEEPPVVTIAGVKSGTTFSAAKAPRLLGGSIVDRGPIKQVKLRLTRRVGDDCRYFSGKSERFVRISCREDGFWFGIGDDADWSYLLPSKLPKGSYVLEVKAIDAAGNAAEPAVKRFRVG
jgi:hypothetical protein